MCCTRSRYFLSGLVGKIAPSPFARETHDSTPLFAGRFTPLVLIFLLYSDLQILHPQQQRDARSAPYRPKNQNTGVNIQIIAVIPHLGAAVVEATLTLQQPTTRHT